MAWQKLASENASGSSTNLSSGTITAKKSLQVLGTSYSDAPSFALTVNNDVGNNYARRYSSNGGADSTSVSQPKIAIFPFNNPAQFFVSYNINVSTEEKLFIVYAVQNNVAGAGSAPNTSESVFKWDNTSSQITEMDIDKTGNFTSDTNLTIFGTD